jgi:hypothetical protein
VRPSRANDVITIPVGAVRRTFAWLLLLGALGLIALAAYSNREQFFGPGASAYVDTRTYQAVWLGSGQTYIGKLEISGDTYILRDVFYLTAPPSDPNNASPQVLGQLVKRGGEALGPVEPMVIPSRAVLFFENLRTDSQVMDAIAQIKSGRASTPAPQTSAPRTATPLPNPTR